VIRGPSVQHLLVGPLLIFPVESGVDLLFDNMHHLQRVAVLAGDTFLLLGGGRSPLAL
jgi:hypothetical protein